MNHAFFNRDDHSEEELVELEKRRIQSIETLSRKTAERKIDLDMVQQDLEKIDESRATIFQALIARGNHSTLLTRLEIHILEGTRLVELETRIQLQLEKLENCDKETLTQYVSINIKIKCLKYYYKF